MNTVDCEGNMTHGVSIKFILTKSGKLIVPLVSALEKIHTLLLSCGVVDLNSLQIQSASGIIYSACTAFMAPSSPLC